MTRPASAGQDEALERVRAHYQTYATEELERLAKDRYARIEFTVTWRFIQEALSQITAGAGAAAPPIRVLDAGSGPGR